MPNKPLFQLEFGGLDGLKKAFKKYAEDIDTDRIILEAMVASGKEVERTAKQLLNEKIYETPASPFYVRTGQLRAGTVSDPTAKSVGGNVGIAVRSKMEYAIYIEFGTSKMKPRAFLLPATEMNRDKILNRMSKALLKFFEAHKNTDIR